MKKLALRSIFMILISATFILGVFPSTGSAAAAATDVSKICKYTTTSNIATFINAYDGIMTNAWTSTAAGTQSITITVPGTAPVAGFYLCWNLVQPTWRLYGVNAKGKRTLAYTGGNAEDWMNEFAAVPGSMANDRKYVIVSGKVNQALSIAEMGVFTNAKPAYAPQWTLYDGKRIDTLVVVAHPDDESLYMGTAIPTAVNEGHTRSLIATMTYSNIRRRFEGLEADWMLGDKLYPAMRCAVDVKTVTKEEAMVYWPLDSIEGYIVALIRKYKPSVIATHDIMGEYWHGAHRLTEYATALAFIDAADPAKFPDSAKQYGVWKAAKLYSHLYGTTNCNNPAVRITQSAYKVLRAYGGKTVLQVISAAYSRHKSQLPGRALPLSSSPYDMQKWGLLETRVGNDIKKNSMYENVSDTVMLRLNPSYNQYIVDRNKLTTALQTAKSKKSSDFTSDSWTAANLPAAIAAAEKVMDDVTSTQPQVDVQVDALNTAAGKLVAVLKSIAITTPATKRLYAIDEPLDIDGLVVTGTYGDGSKKIIPISKDSIDGFDSSQADYGQVLTIAFSGMQASYTVDIALPDSIAVTTEASKLTYQVGDELSLAGLVVTGTYSDGSHRAMLVATSDVAGFDSSAPYADQVLTITVQGASATYMVTIEGPPPTSAPTPTQDDA